MVDWRSDADQPLDPLVFATYAQAYPASKTETSQQQGSAWKFCRKKFECGAYIIEFARSSIVLPFAESRSAEVEPQYRHLQTVQSFRRLVYNLVVKCSAKKRMRVANQCSTFGRGIAMGRPQYRFQFPHRTVQKKIP